MVGARPRVPPRQCICRGCCRTLSPALRQMAVIAARPDIAAFFAPGSAITEVYPARISLAAVPNGSPPYRPSQRHEPR
jgi:hypothetical protein